MPKPLSYMLNDKALTHVGFFDPDVVTDSYLDVEANVIRSFTSRQAFLKVVKGAGFPNIQDAVNKLDDARASYGAMKAAEQATLETKQVAAYKDKQLAIRSLLKKEGISHTDQDALLELHKSGKIGSMIVYDSKGCVGDWAYFPPGTYPKLSWFGWNDRISSFYNLGLLASLHQHTWFRGATLWVPLFARNCDMGWWSDRISSMIFYS